MAGHGLIEGADPWSLAVDGAAAGPLAVSGVLADGADLQILSAAIAGDQGQGGAVDSRLATFRMLLPRVGAELVRALLAGLAGDGRLAAWLAR